MPPCRKILLICGVNPNRMKISIKNISRKKGEFQFYMHQFVEACARQNIPFVDELHVCVRLKLNGVMMNLGHWMDFFRCQSTNKAIVVCTSGGGLMYTSFPYSLFYEIIPVFWDSWPFSWEEQIYSLKRLRCKTCFVTSNQVAQRIKQTLPDMNVYWLPEGIDISDYEAGSDLVKRNIEIYELGRQNSNYHKVLCDLKSEGAFTNFLCNEYDEKGLTIKLAFPTAELLLSGLSNIKIVISFPQVDTHPEKVGDIETLTQRYWEAMLSRNLIIGRAPNELIRMIGYNPVIDVDWEEPKKQLSDILSNIESYQILVDRNYHTAKEMASWDNRAKDVIAILRTSGYEI